MGSARKNANKASIGFEMGDTFNAKNSETITRKEVEATLRIQTAIITLHTVAHGPNMKPILNRMEVGPFFPSYCNRNVTLETPCIFPDRPGSVIQWKNCHVENNIINRTPHTFLHTGLNSRPTELIGCTFVE